MSYKSRIKQTISAVKERGLMKSLCYLFFCCAKPLIRFIVERLRIEEDHVLFYSKPSFADNSKVFYEYLMKNSVYKGYSYYWLTDRIPDTEKEDKTTFICYKSSIHGGISFKAIKAIATSGIIFYTHGLPEDFLGRKEGQHFINLWHGCGYKDMKPAARKLRMDYGLVPGPLYIPSKARIWECGEDRVLPIGYPRYDLMKENDRTLEFIHGLFEGKELKHTLLWLPTFRQSVVADYAEGRLQTQTGLPLADTFDKLDELNKHLSECGTGLIIKRHPSQKKYPCEERKFGNICMLDNASLAAGSIDLYELFASVDGLISDYSSAAVDYLLTDRPVAYTLDDLESYNEARGFVFDDPLKYMPGHHLFSQEDMKGYIDDIFAGRDPYREKRRELLSLMQNPCDDYCKRLYDALTDLKVLRKN